jgi:GTP cyclohydrolase II
MGEYLDDLTQRLHVVLFCGEDLLRHLRPVQVHLACKSGKVNWENGCKAAGSFLLSFSWLAEWNVRIARNFRF